MDFEFNILNQNEKFEIELTYFFVQVSFNGNIYDAARRCFIIRYPDRNLKTKIRHENKPGTHGILLGTTSIHNTALTMY